MRSTVQTVEESRGHSPTQFTPADATLVYSTVLKRLELAAFTYHEREVK